MSFLPVYKKQVDPSVMLRDTYITELRDVNSRISAVRREFDLVSDDALIEGIIFELLSLSNRQRFLLTEIKALSQCAVVKEKLPSGAN